uniref:hypothetical protein n=1 Tax=Aeromonas caviae TaxID=648 RepID=UPI002B49FDD8
TTGISAQSGITTLSGKSVWTYGVKSSQPLAVYGVPDWSRTSGLSLRRGVETCLILSKDVCCIYFNLLNINALSVFSSKAVQIF